MIECKYQSLARLRESGLDPELLPTDEEAERVNDLFKHYIFFRSDKARNGRYITTTCCGRKNLFYQKLRRVEEPEHWALAYGRHNEFAVCPFCGRGATLKNIGRSGTRERLTEYKPVLFLRAREDGALRAFAAWTMKEYKEEKWLAAGAEYKPVALYTFELGRAVMKPLWRIWGDQELDEVDVFSNSTMRQIAKISEPFAERYGWSEHYCRYFVMGLEAIGESDFRYCQYDRWSCWREMTGAPHDGLCRFLSLCCLYPRDTEMLIKNEMNSMVSDFVYRRKKNKDIYTWGAGTPLKAFGLDGQEMRAFLDGGKDLRELLLYKRMRRAKFRSSFVLASEIESSLCVKDLEFLSLCWKTGTEPARALRWLKKESVWGRRIRGYLDDRVVQWGDYIYFCRELGYDLRNETVAMPKDFMRRHDEAAEEFQRMETRRREEEDAEKRRLREGGLDARAKKYDFERGELFIRVARSAEEIVKEGKAQEHCVGGYAERHMNGITTILFLRRKAEPDKPFVTVQMDGNRMIQAHGHKNEREPGAEDPTKKYKSFFTAWQDWLGRGSPRNEDGTPKLPKKERKKKGDAAA